MASLTAVTGVVVAMVLGAASCSSKPDVVYYHTDYASYQSSAELYERANLVMRARIADNPEVREIVIDDQGTTLVYTVYQAQIRQVLKGTPDRDVIEIKQLGGDLDGVTYVAQEVIDLAPRKTYVLFLEAYPDSPASLINPSQGQYLTGPRGTLLPVGGNAVQIAEADVEAMATR